MGRIIIFTGKGGVGKSSVAAAHALLSAKENRKTLLVSADMAHNLGDIFQTTIGHKITKISENLDALELNPNILRHEMFPKIKDTFLNLAGSYGLGLNNINDNFSVPCFSNLLSLLKIKELYDSKKYERIFIDCAPTGETIALLKIPELLAWYMEKFFPVGKVMVRMLSPISKIKYGVTLPDRESMNTVEKIHKKLLELQELLKNKEICSTRLVCIPEKMIVEETKRNYMYLNLYKYQTDTVFINRVLDNSNSNTENNDFINHWKTIQSKYIKELEEVFVNVPIVKIPWFSKEILGLSAVETLCETIKNSSDNLFDIKTNFEHEEYISCEDGYILNLYLPQAKKENMEIYFHDTDINIKLNNFNRCIPLPNVLKGSRIVETKLENEILSIHFQTLKETKDTEEKS